MNALPRPSLPPLLADHLHDPVTGEWREMPALTSPVRLEEQLQMAVDASTVWQDTPVAERLRLLEYFTAVLDFRGEAIAREISSLIGKPLHESFREVEKCRQLAVHYGKVSAALLRPREIRASHAKRRLEPTPLGRILTISPSNFPLWQAVRSSLPAIIAGNVVLNKPSPHGAPLGETLVELMRVAGFPPGVFQCCHLEPEATLELIGHEVIHGVAFTGGREAGRAIGAAAGRALKPVVLELGGNDAALILEDADLEGALFTCVRSRLYNNGQTCLGPKRLLVHTRHYARAVAMARKLAAATPHGDPFTPDIARGPLVGLRARDRLHAQIRATLESGATLLHGGSIPAGPGAFYPATVLCDVPVGSPLFTEELFGPVIALTRVEDEDSAVAAANASRYGLAASIFTAHAATARRLARRLLVANVGWNTVARSGPEFPFGGIRESGHGRELGDDGLLNFTYPKVYAGMPSDSPAVEA
jgi:succinate-semialdehyde dehydrogenase / glutarate-semialdehyde dehydrogenase